MYTNLEEEHVMCCRICRSSFVEKKVYDVVPSLIKGNVLHRILLQRKTPSCLEGGVRCIVLTRISRKFLDPR